MKPGDGSGAGILKKTELCVQLIVLPALNDDGAPSYDKGHAEFLASIGVPTFACTPDKFPDLMAAALSKQDIGMWVSQNVKSE